MKMVNIDTKKYTQLILADIIVQYFDRILTCHK